MKKSKKMGRPMLGKRPLTASERNQRHRNRLTQAGARQFMLWLLGRPLKALEIEAAARGMSPTHTIEILMVERLQQLGVFEKLDAQRSGEATGK